MTEDEWRTKVCRECADREPNGSAITVNLGICPKCHQEKPLAQLHSWGREKVATYYAFNKEP